MTNEKKIAELSHALTIIDGLLMDAEEQWEVKVYSKLFEKVNSVYNAFCEEMLDEKRKQTLDTAPTLG